MRKATLILLATFTAAHASAHAAGVTFNYVVTGIQATDLGDLGGLNSQAFDINDLGDIVGWSRDSSRHRIIWHEDFGMIALPALGNNGTCGASSNCQCSAIENRRTSEGRVQVVGRCSFNND